ncbi:hypothetical protein [Actinoplanes sp. NPDC051859]|uniref:hypothetical protein n=1 Tax=Actinoplanes sp. NPDC051859 TaxID=3363909 RepID=UPI003792804D
MNSAWQSPEVTIKSLPLEFGRPFSVFAMAPTHRQLLLRSPMGNEWEDRIDVILKGVVAMKVKTQLPDLVISAANDREVADVDLDCEADLRRNESFKVYMLRAGKFRGYVVAASAWMARDRRPANDPSPLLFDIEGTPMPERIIQLI